MSTSRCSRCGGKVRRVRRTFGEKLFYTAAYLCESCNQRQLTGGLLLGEDTNCAHCPSCGSNQIRKQRRVDQIEGFYQTPFRWLLKQLGMPLYYCRFCRIQFYDRRKSVTSREAKPVANQVQSGISIPIQEIAACGWSQADITVRRR